MAKIQFTVKNLIVFGMAFLNNWRELDDSEDSEDFIIKRDEFDQKLIDEREHILQSYTQKTVELLRKFCRSIINSAPPGFFTYYYIFPEFRDPENITEEYFGVEERYPKRRRIIKEMDKLKKEYGTFRQLTRYDHIVKVNNETAAYIYVDLRKFIPIEHRKNRLEEKNVVYAKIKPKNRK